MPWSNISRCFPCLLFMLEQAKGVERVREGFALIFLLWFYAWATDSTKKSFPVCSSCLRSTLPFFPLLLPG